MDVVVGNVRQMDLIIIEQILCELCYDVSVVLLHKFTVACIIGLCSVVGSSIA